MGRSAEDCIAERERCRPAERGTWAHGRNVSDGLRRALAHRKKQREAEEKSAFNIRFLSFMDEVMGAVEIDGLPRARSMCEAEAMGDIRPYIPDKRIEALKQSLRQLIKELEVIEWE